MLTTERRREKEEENQIELQTRRLTPMESNAIDIATHVLTDQKVIITNGTTDFSNRCAVCDSSFIGDRISASASAAFASVGSVMVVGGVTGNSMLIAVILRRFLRKRCAHNLFIVNLSLADILTLGYWLTFFVLDMILGYHPVASALHCRANGFVIATLCVVSVTSLMCISLNRYIHVCWPHLYKRTFTLRTIVVLCLGLWLLALILVLPPAVAAGKGVGAYTYNTRTHVCSFDRKGWTYPKIMVITFSVLPMVVIGLCSFAIFRFWSKAKMRLSNRYALTKAGTENRRQKPKIRQKSGSAAEGELPQQEKGNQSDLEGSKDAVVMEDDLPVPSEGSCNHSSRSEGEENEEEKEGESSASSRSVSYSSYWDQSTENGLPCPSATVDMTRVLMSSRSPDAFFSPLDGSDEETAFAAQVNRDSGSLAQEQLPSDVVHRRLMVNVPRSQNKRDKQSFHILVTRASSTGNVHVAGADVSDRDWKHGKNEPENCQEGDIPMRAAGDLKDGSRTTSRSSLKTRLSVPRLLSKRRARKGGGKKAKGREIPAADTRPGDCPEEEAASKQIEQRDENTKATTSPERPRRCSCKCWTKAHPADEGSSSEGELPSTQHTQRAITAAFAEVRVEKEAVCFKAASMPALHHLSLVEEEAEEDDEEKDKRHGGCDRTSGKTRSLPLAQHHGCKQPQKYGDAAQSATLWQSSPSSIRACSFRSGLCGKTSLTSASVSPTSVAPAPRLLPSPASILSRYRQTRCRSNAAPGKRSSLMYKLRRRQQEHKAREVAFVRSLFVVFILMFVCFIPYGLIVLLESIPSIALPTEVSIFGNMCLFLNNSVNWIVYGAMNPTFRRGYIKYLRRLYQGCKLQPLVTGLAGSLSSLMTASSLPRLNWTEDAKDGLDEENNGKADTRGGSGHQPDRNDVTTTQP